MKVNIYWFYVFVAISYFLILYILINITILNFDETRLDINVNSSRNFIYDSINFSFILLK